MATNFILASIFTLILALISFAFGVLFFNERAFGETFGRIEYLSPKMRRIVAIVVFAILLIIAAISLSVMLTLAEK